MDRPDPFAAEFPDPVPLRAGSPRLAYPVGIDYFLDRLERDDPFYFSKINHGVWERYLDVERQKLEGVQDPSSTSRVFVLEGEFMHELAADLMDIPRSRSFVFGVSPLAFADHETVTGKEDAAEIAAMIDAMLPDGFIPVAGTVFKDACISGEIARLWDLLRERDVVVVGPDYLASLEQRLPFNSFTLEPIHPTAAHEDRSRILDRLLALGGPAAGLVFLVQAGPLSFWLAKRMFEEIPAATMLDLGIVLNLWLPEEVRPPIMPWERIFQRQFRDRLGIDLASPAQRASRDRIERLTGGVQPALVPPPEHPVRPITYVDDKPIDAGFITAALLTSREANQWSNFGPASLELEQAIADYLGLPDDSKVVMTANGTAALIGLVRLRDFLEGRELKWATSAFGFFCTVQSRLSGSRVIDCDESGMLSRRVLRETDLDGVEGVIITHLFGAYPKQVSSALNYCAEAGLHAIVDGAAAFDSIGRDGHPPGTWEVLSFHHTKPAGMGEGGAAIVPADLEDTFRSLINFGTYRDIDTGPHSMNGKMSDLAAAAIMQRLYDLPQLSGVFRAQYQRIERVAAGAGWETLTPRPGLGRLAALATPAGVPLLAPIPIPPGALANDHVVLRKYYRPLTTAAPTAWAIYDRIVNFPCHPGVGVLTEDEIAATLQQVLEQAEAG